MRTKVFGQGAVTPLDRNAKARLAHLAKCLTKRTDKGHAWGAITAKHLVVFLTLLYGFHNSDNGKCFPSYARIAEKSLCSTSTVGEAIKALESAKLITWQQRRMRVKIPQENPFGGFMLVTRIVRTSNAYTFSDPQHMEPLAKPPNTENRRETTNQIQDLSAKKELIQPAVGLADALSRLKSAMRRDLERKRLPVKEGTA